MSDDALRLNGVAQLVQSVAGIDLQPSPQPGGTASPDPSASTASGQKPKAFKRKNRPQAALENKTLSKLGRQVDDKGNATVPLHLVR